MSKIKIQHFGPIREGFTENDGWMDINKVTVFIGNQGSGKSTVAKLISSFTWMEKVLVRGDKTQVYFESNDCFKNEVLAYHRLEGYLKSGPTEKSHMEYEGNAYHFIFTNGHLKICEKQYEFYELPQIMYIPAERNFIAYVKSPKDLKLSSDSMQEFIAEFENAKEWMKGAIALPVNDTLLEYDKLNDTLHLNGKNFDKLKLSDASSGFQSLVPLYLVSKFLTQSLFEKSRGYYSAMSSSELTKFKKEVAEIMANTSLTDIQKKAAISVISDRFNKAAFINIVEEPEQNLFPSSQWKMIQSLMNFNNLDLGNKLIMTTHSPYIINYLSILIQGRETEKKLIGDPFENNIPDMTFKLRAILDPGATIDTKDVTVYEMDETSGIIRRVPNIYGIPSDKNYLNEMLHEGNVIFDKLLEIEESLT